MTKNAERLARRVRARREELDLSQLDVWQAGGPSNTTLTEIENGRVEKLTRTTARRLDAGLQWEPGSAKRVWDGEGEPTALVPTRSLEDLRRRVSEAEFLSDEQKAEILASLDRPPPLPTRGVKGA